MEIITGRDAIDYPLEAGDYVTICGGNNNEASLCVVERILPNWVGKYGGPGAALLKRCAEPPMGVKRKTVRVYKQMTWVDPKYIAMYMFSR